MGGLSCWRKDARIIIGNNVGISGGGIVLKDRVEVGDGMLIGADATIIDTDFHPVASNDRHYETKNVKSALI